MRTAQRAEPTPSSMLILPCASCGRSVKVFGKVRRVLCACGEILLEVEATKVSEADRSR